MRVYRPRNFASRVAWRRFRADRRARLLAELGHPPTAAQEIVIEQAVDAEWAALRCAAHGEPADREAMAQRDGLLRSLQALGMGRRQQPPRRRPEPEMPEASDIDRLLAGLR